MTEASNKESTKILICKKMKDTSTKLHAWQKEEVKKRLSKMEPILKIKTWSPSCIQTKELDFKECTNP